jgi:hypothetical protein
MKTKPLLLLLFPLILLFPSCDKNPDIYPDPSTAELLIGSWHESTSTLTLYDASSEKISEEAQPLRTATFYGTGKFDYRYVNEQALEGNYKLSKDTKDEYITFTTSTNESLVFKIIQISDKELTVSCETHHVTYYVNEKPLIAATSIRKMTLSKM